MADSQVNQYRREQEQAERYMSADDLDACFEPDEEPTVGCPYCGSSSPCDCERGYYDEIIEEMVAE